MNQALASSPSSLSFSERLALLRTEIRQAGLDGFLAPMGDEYQNEYVPPSAKRIEFLTGFTGSAAFVVILHDRAAFFTDSRYTLQAQRQVPPELFEVFETSKKLPLDWLKEQLRAQMKVGFDPRLHTARQIERFEVVLLKINASLSPVEENPIDAIWTDRPPVLAAPIVPHDVAYAGKSSAHKRQELAEDLRKNNLNAAVITDPSSIAWLLNVRGGDVPMTPLPLSAAILKADGHVEWYVDPRKISAGLEGHLGSDVLRYDETDFPAALKRLGEARARVLLDMDESSYRVLSLLRQSGATIQKSEDPCALPRACKNQTEIDGMRSAHRRDGAAIVKFLAWLDANGLSGKITELEAEEKLESFRAEGSLYKGPSFETIAAAGANGAVVHYRATKETNAKIEAGSFFLLDSGGQYLDGTTDITRTVPIGEASPEMKDRYTRVLKGHIALASIRFPEGTWGAELDVLARQFLWAEGLDYGHGTGHGVGSYLCVHEGPQSISRRGNVPLRVGMVVSNEPGYYKAKHYGIRLENLQSVIELFEINSPDMKMFGFETLTLAPFDRRAIAPELLTKAEKDWLNAYHARVYKALRPQLDKASSDWLEKATTGL